MKPQSLPCTTQRCLKYPACKYKVSVYCDLLTLYYQLYFAMHMSNISTEVWKRINQDLPYLNTIEANYVNGMWHLEVRKPKHYHQTPYGIQRGRCVK